MKRSLIVFALLLGATANAHADQMVFHFYDTIRPHGHKRDDAIGQANIDSCIAKVGVQYEHASAAYKECMRGLGYIWMSDTLQRDAKTSPRHPQSRGREIHDRSASESGTAHGAQ
jgi:hypothetical protein